MMNKETVIKILFVFCVICVVCSLYFILNAKTVYSCMASVIAGCCCGVMYYIDKGGRPPKAS